MSQKYYGTHSKKRKTEKKQNKKTRKTTKKEKKSENRNKQNESATIVPNVSSRDQKLKEKKKVLLLFKCHTHYLHEMLSHSKKEKKKN